MSNNDASENINFNELFEESRISKALRDLHPEAEEVKLYLWQENAVRKWVEKDPNLKQGDFEDGEYRGIVQAVTGAGKTVFALECINVWLQSHPTGHITVLVPTRALQRQWRRILMRAFDEDIGVLGGGRRDWKQMNVVTMDTAT